MLSLRGNYLLATYKFSGKYMQNKNTYNKVVEDLTFISPILMAVKNSKSLGEIEEIW